MNACPLHYIYHFLFVFVHLILFLHFHIPATVTVGKKKRKENSLRSIMDHREVMRREIIYPTFVLKCHPSQQIGTDHLKPRCQMNGPTLADGNSSAPFDTMSYPTWAGTRVLVQLVGKRCRRQQRVDVNVGRMVLFLTEQDPTVIVVST